VFRGRTSDEWLALLGEAGVPSAPVNDVPAALAEARVVEYEHPRLGPVRQVASPLSCRGRSRRCSRPGARRAHERVLTELCGIRAGAVQALSASGVFGDERKES
jgi:crotonobetainyl-CoA:carnitine CoA-transferase CaiB-like acyl-CoA transferase